MLQDFASVSAVVTTLYAELFTTAVCRHKFEPPEILIYKTCVCTYQNSTYNSSYAA